MSNPLTQLREWLCAQAPESIKDVQGLETVLAAAWPLLNGSGDQSTSPDKLHGRIEKPTWAPPILTFIIERHGATVNGSTRAAIHHWTVNVDEKTAICNANYSYRQLQKMAKRLDVNALAQEIATLIVDGSEDDRLKWKADKKTVTVDIGSFVSGSSQQTISSRRKRFREALEPLLHNAGWVPAVGTKPNTYIHSASKVAN